jgi:hypothetical protein
MLTAVNLDPFCAEPLRLDPFPHLIMTDFIRDEVLEAVLKDFPAIDKPGSFPLRGLDYGGAFAHLIEELQGDALRAAFAEKFGVDLSKRPPMITLRGMCRAKDGQIHTDSRSKIITVLIYLNRDWKSQDGRLRLLRSPDNLEDAFAEVSPEAGTLLAFLNTQNAWHGHSSYSGERRSIQLNWVTDSGVVAREQKRHRISAFFKKLNPL